MKHYEILLLIHPDQSNQVNAMIDRYRAVITKGNGKVHRQEDWGKLQLAYQINKLHKAHYILLNIECEHNTITELNNAFKFNDAVIRSLVTKCDEAITEPSIFFKSKDMEKNAKDSGGYNNYYEPKAGAGIEAIEPNFNDSAE